MTKKYFLYTLVLLLMLITSACTTTTTTLSTGYSVNQDSQLDKAKKAFTEKRYPQAIKLLTPLANQGQDFAQYALGYMYYNGMGVERNLVHASHWLKASASQGNENAIEALSLLSASGFDSSQSKDKPAALPEDKTIVAEKQPEPVKVVTQPVTKKSNPVRVNKPHSREISADTKEIDKPDSINPDEGTSETALVKENVVEEPVEKQTDKADLTKDERWLMSQPDENYTIQLTISYSEKAIKAFITENNLKGEVVYYRSPNKGRDLYILVKGSFERFSVATNEISEMSEELKKSNPWVITIKSVKEKLLSR